VLLLLADGTRLPVAELPGDGPWTFLVLQPSAPDPASPGTGAASTDPAPGFLTRYGRVVVPDLGGRPGFGAAPGEPGFLGLVDDLDQVRTRAGLGRPVLVGLGELAAVALRAGGEQPWAWRALVLAPGRGGPPAPAELAALELPTLVLGGAGPDQARDGVEVVPAGDRLDEPRLAAAVERLLARLGTGPGWAGIAPDAPPR
jgi:pimeloyl-ACP methyl ester carboxylesterase